MEKTTKRIAVLIMLAIFLLAACASPQAATQDPELDQQLINQSLALTAAEQNLQTKDKQLAERAAALTAVAQTAEALKQALPTTPSSESDTANSTGQPAPLPSESDSADSTGISAPLPTEPDSAATPPAMSDTTTPSLLINDPIYGPIPLFVPTKTTFLNCVLTITHVDEDPEIFGLPTRVPTLDLDPNRGDSIIITQPVNLRSGPSFTNQILMVLRPDPTVYFRVIGGPVYTDLGGSSFNVTPKPGSNILRRKYKWWQIESLNQAVNGWVAEASACGKYYFITPAPTATPTPQ